MTLVLELKDQCTSEYLSIFIFRMQNYHQIDSSLTHVLRSFLDRREEGGVTIRKDRRKSHYPVEALGSYLPCDVTSIISVVTVAQRLGTPRKSTGHSLSVFPVLGQGVKPYALS